MMQIIDFTADHIEAAARLARQNYEEERGFVPALPPVDKLPDLTYFAENGLGVSALVDGEMIGFLCFYTPWDNAFTTNSRGTFSPVHAHGAVYENRERIYRRLYQSAAEKLVKMGVGCHSVGLYAHDKQAIETFFTYGFGLRCMDAIRPMEPLPDIQHTDCAFREISKKEVDIITPLRKGLSEHLSKSPCFMAETPQDFEAWLKRAIGRDSRVFIAEKNKQAAAFIEVQDGGENFASDNKSMTNICGAFCLTEHRGSGLYQSLLNFMISVLKRGGYTRLGVDFESFNPTAYSFWLKYFSAYTNSVVRRIDEKAMEV